MISFKTCARVSGVLAAVLSLSAANAASTLENLGGTVRVNQGKGFAVVQGAGAVNPGDTIIADPKGKGRLVYGDGCTVNVNPGAIVTVAEVSPCSLSAQVSDPSQPGGPNVGLIAVAGIAGAGAVAAGVAASSNRGGNNVPFILPAASTPRPASP